MEYALKYCCDFLVDQNRYIGNDNVGHSCTNDAESLTSEGALICKECIIMKEKNPERIILKPFYGIECQKIVFESLLEQWKSKT